MNFFINIQFTAFIISLSLNKVVQSMQCYVCMEDLKASRSSGCRDDSFDVSRVQVQTPDTQLNIGRIVILPSSFNCSVCAVYQLHSYHIIIRSCLIVNMRLLRKVLVGEATFCFTDYCNDNSASSSSISSLDNGAVFQNSDDVINDASDSKNRDSTRLEADGSYQGGRQIDNLYILYDIKHFLAAISSSPPPASAASRITWSYNYVIHWLILVTCLLCVRAT